MMQDRAGQKLTDQEIARWTRTGMLAALAMVLGYLETFIPIPIPGVKLGLANIAVLIALAHEDISGAFWVGLIKVLSTGLLFGNPLTMAYSAAGTLLAFTVMAPLAKVRELSIVLISMAGALAHEAGQLVVAMMLLGTPLVWYSAPVLAIAGCITGALCGAVTARVLTLDASRKSAHEGEGISVSADEPSETSTFENYRTTSNPRIHPDTRALLVAFLVFAAITLHLTSTPLLLAALLIALVACALGRVSAKAFLQALRPTLFIAFITCIAQIASFQQGTTLCSIGPVNITSEALLQTWIMTARLAALVGASVAVMHLATPSELISAISWLLSPLRAIGFDTRGFTLALNVALAAVPTILAAFESQPWNWRNWRTEVPRFIAEQMK